MKHKKRKYESNDMTILRTVVDMLKSSNEELQAEVNRLRNEIAETNAMNIQADEKDKDYRNLTQLHTLLMVLMNMLTAHIDDSPLADAVGKAIK